MTFLFSVRNKTMNINHIFMGWSPAGWNRLATAILALAHRWLILPPSRTNWQLGMKKFLPFLFLVLVLGLSGHMQAQPLPDFQNEEVVQRIAFGSCLYPRPNKVAIFNGILRQKPDVFIFLGDNIYGDTTDMELLAKKWNALGAVEGFKKLSETSTILATWDDHDYGVNDGGKSFPMRLESESSPSHQLIHRSAWCACRHRLPTTNTPTFSMRPCARPTPCS